MDTVKEYGVADISPASPSFLPLPISALEFQSRGFKVSGSLVEGLIKQAGCFSVTALRGLSRSGRSRSAEKPGKLPAAPRSYLK